MGVYAPAPGFNTVMALAVASLIFGYAGGFRPRVSEEDGMLVKGDTAQELNVQDRGEGRGPVVSLEILEDPWTPAWEVERIANAVGRRAEDLPGPG